LNYSTNPYISLLSVAWQYARQYRKKYVLVYTLFVFANIVAAVRPILYGWFINEIQKNPNTILNTVTLFVAGYILVELMEWAFHGPARVYERELAFHISQNYLQESYHKTLHLPVKWHQDHHSGNTINRVRKAYEAIKHFFQGGFMYLHAIFKFLSSVIAMFYFSPLFGAISLILGVITILIIMRFDKPLMEAMNEVNEKEHVVSATLFDSLSNIITVITLRLEKSMETGLMSKVKDVFKPFRREVVLNEWKWFFASILVAIIYLIMAAGYIFQNYIPGQVFLVGGLITLLGFVNQFTSVFHDVAWQYGEIMKYNTDLQAANSIHESYDAMVKNEVKKPLNSWQKIQLHNINFQHDTDIPHDEKKVGYASGLFDIKVQIQRGQRIALVGESGSGKSTLLAVLRGLYIPKDDAEVVIDDMKYKTMTPVYDQVTLFPQDPEIFENTINYNITMGLDFTQESIDEACQIAQMKEVIAQLPKGMESNIQEKGVNLSGGQKQRLALARGILAAAQSSIILMDEPTSSVDPKTEIHIFEALFQKFSNKVFVASIHRLHLLKYFDQVYVIHNGRIESSGSFQEVSAKSKIFQELWRHQEVDTGA
jgi:ATP-binding cassette, subfamily B, bacterial